MCGKGAQISADVLIASLAEKQHGVLGVAQLLAAGLTRRQVEQRVPRRRLHPLHRGVYAVGHAVESREGRWMAAVLACGEGAALRHGDAAALWGIRHSAAAVVRRDGSHA